ncbi:MAG: sugar phosphate isomerase/epimerase [Bacteroidota bacterium]
MKRRDFVKSSVLGLSYLSIAPNLIRCSSASEASEIGIQLYSLRTLLEKDFTGTIEKVAEIGFTHVELFNYENGKIYGFSAKEIAEILSNSGLRATSGHIALGEHTPDKVGTLANGWKKAAEDAKLMGQEFIVCPWLEETERDSIEDYKRHAETFNRCAEIAEEIGLQFAYHNHDFEFKVLDGEMPMNILLEECDPALVKFELDLYWVHRAGKDPLAIFNRHKKRFPLWHVKDMDSTPEKYFAPVGDGVIDWKKMFKNQKIAGLKYFYVEQDHFRKYEPLDAVEKSINYLKELGV